MSLFKSKKKAPAQVEMAAGSIPNYSALAELTLNAIQDGVLLVDESGLIKFANPAAAEMVGYGSPNNMLGLSFELVLRLENAEGMMIPPEQSKLTQYFMANQPLTTREYVLVSMQAERRASISLTLTPTGGPKANKIITFRDISKELEEEEKQSEFISTASHEMRTPVASIEGYLALALNPQTATIDQRARQYLDAAHKSSQHLGRLFKDLLDVSKLEDGRAKLHLVPVEIISTVREMATSREKDVYAKQLRYSFGSNTSAAQKDHQLNQLAYAAVDVDFLREILDNLIDNAIKYTPEGGEVSVNARGDGDKILISVSDSGIGISPEDAGHIFQKFYRVDNSQTRQIGGTGLGLYLVKQRAEAMGGRVWVESAFGNGSTFYVSLPRLSAAEYEKRRIAYENSQTVQAFAEANSQKSQFMGTPASSAVNNRVAAGAAGGAGAGVAAGVQMVTKPVVPGAASTAVNVAPATPQVMSAATQTAAQAMSAAPQTAPKPANSTVNAAPAVQPAARGVINPPANTAPSVAPAIQTATGAVNPAATAAPQEALNPVYQNNHTITTNKGVA